MERWGTVEQHQVFLDDLFEHVPHFGFDPLDQFLGGFDVADDPVGHQALHDKGLEQLQSHLFGQTTLMEFEIGTDHDHRTTGIVDALTQQVLPETALLAFEHVAE